MRFDSIRLRGIGPFQTEQFVDLTQHPGALIAISGDNGAGKTTLLGCLAGGLFREVPTRGTLASLATARDAFVEVGACNGAAYKVRQTVDNLTAKGETLITDATGATVLENAKVSSGDKWIAEHFPSAAVLLSSSFSAQGRRGFLDMGKGDRKKLLVELLDLQRFERMAAEARQFATDTGVDISVSRARLRDLREVASADLLAADIESKRAAAAAAQEAHAGAVKALDRARAAAGDAARAAELVEQRNAAEARRELAVRQLADKEARLSNNRDVLDRGALIRDTVARLAALELEREAARQTHQAATEALTLARVHLASAAAELSAAQGATSRARARATSAEVRLVARAQVAAAVAELGALREQEPALVRSYEAAGVEIERLTVLLLSGKEHRIDAMRGELRYIVSGDWHADGCTPGDVAETTLSVDDASAAAQAEAPALLVAAKRARDTENMLLATLRQRLAQVERLAARADEMAAAQRELDAAVAETQACAAAEPELETKHAAANAACQAALAAWDAVATLPQKLDEQIEALKPVAGQLVRLQTAEDRIEELTAELVPLRAALAAVDAELAALPVIATLSIDLGTYERAVAAREVDQRAAHAALARAEDALAANTVLAEKAAELKAEIAQLETALADWTRLAQDLGRDGLQALELDACLPEITAIANALLHQCHGSRFTVELRTDRLSADGKKTIEDLECRVIDTVKGRDADADTYSGGELVLVSTAISLALTTIACRRAGIERPTLSFDESGAALDAENARAWIAMLRLAMKHIDAANCLFISHSDELKSLADVRIDIVDGQVGIS